MDGRNPAPLQNHGKLFVGIYRGIESFYGFSGDAKWISSIHSIVTRQGFVATAKPRSEALCQDLPHGAVNHESDRQGVLFAHDRGKHLVARSPPQSAAMRIEARKSDSAKQGSSDCNACVFGNYKPARYMRMVQIDFDIF